MGYGKIKYGDEEIERGFDELHAGKDSWVRYRVDKSWMPKHV
jgi:hypothetical protein